MLITSTQRGKSNAICLLCAKAPAVHYRCLAGHKRKNTNKSAASFWLKMRTALRRWKEAPERRRRRWGAESEEAGGWIDKWSDMRGQSALLQQPAEVQNGFCHNETITLTKDPALQRSEAIMLRGQGQAVRFLQLTSWSANNGAVPAFLILLCVTVFKLAFLFLKMTLDEVAGKTIWSAEESYHTLSTGCKQFASAATDGLLINSRTIKPHCFLIWL